MAREPRAKPSARIVELILVEFPYGEGTSEDRVVGLRRYFEKDGTLVFEVNPFDKEKS